MNITLKKISLLIIFLYSSFAFGQQSAQLFLNPQIAQSALLNPAIQISCKYYIGIPLLSSPHLSYQNSSFSYNDLTQGNLLNLDQVYKQLIYSNFASVQFEIYPLSLGFRHKSFYYSFHIADKANVFASYPKKLIGLSLYGNNQFLGKKARFNNLRVNSVYYREYSFGFSSIYDLFTTIGVRGKILFGKANLSTGQSRFSLESNETSFDLLAAGKIKLNSSYPFILTQNSSGMINNVLVDYPDYMSLIFNYRNPGIAFDAGIIRKYRKKITLSASILDLGFIRWSSDVNNIKAQADFSYSGIDAGSSFNAGSFIDELVDSIDNSTDIQISQKPYFSMLPLKIYAGAEYLHNENFSLGIVSRNIIANRRLHASITLMANHRIKEKFISSLGWSYMNNSLKNIGAGVAWAGRGFQFHAFSDNVLGFFQPFDTRTIDLQFGMNLMIGCPHDRREARVFDSLYGRIPGGDCSWVEHSRNKNKYLKKVSRKRKY